jgi:hypothetical protein
LQEVVAAICKCKQARNAIYEGYEETTERREVLHAEQQSEREGALVVLPPQG